MLENNSVTITTSSYVDNINVTKTFDNLILDNNNEICVEFQVPPNLKTIDCSYNCSYKQLSFGGSTQKLSSHWQYSLETNTNPDIPMICESYLRRLKGIYYFYVLGKNGEPLSNTQVNFTFHHAIYNSSAIVERLYTDEEGKVELGSLDNILKVETTVSAGNDKHSFRCWAIPIYREMINYPRSLELLEDETIELPIPCSKLSINDVSLLSFSKNRQTISNCYDHCELVTKDGEEFNELKISGLPQGNYQLDLKKLNLMIRITVHDGVYWETEGFIQKKNAIIEVKRDSRYLRISDVRISEEAKGDEKAKLRFKLNETGISTRAHVFAYTFMPTQPILGYNQMRMLMNENRQLTSFPFSKWKNVYDSNRKLGDEYRYVFNRKNAKRFIGNTLEKPQLLMKRFKIGGTVFDTEVIRDGAKYANTNPEEEYDTREMAESTSRNRGSVEQNNLEKI